MTYHYPDVSERAERGMNPHTWRAGPFAHGAVLPKDRPFFCRREGLPSLPYPHSENATLDWPRFDETDRVQGPSHPRPTAALWPWAPEPSIVSFGLRLGHDPLFLAAEIFWGDRAPQRPKQSLSTNYANLPPADDRDGKVDMAS